MDLTSKPNLKPFRDYDEHQVVNLYAHASGDVNKGTWVAITVADGNTNVTQNQSTPATPHLKYSDALSPNPNVPSRATVLRPEVSWKVDTATASSTVLGIMLYDVKTNNEYGENYLYRPSRELSEQQIVKSGDAVPILTRGLVKLNGFTGTPGPNSGATIGSGANAGMLVVSSYTNSVGCVGKFLTSADADGYAIFKVEL